MQSNPDSIYYHRELLCHSLDQRRIDLITISACNNISFKREPKFDPKNLFPVADKNDPTSSKRCYAFEKKKVYVLTSRVHPGETPASFVFNGFLEFILKKDDPRARVLRRNFVFKLVPMLNPDGVCRGHYRTDQLGVNLNRVYLDPSFRLHPSIYAIKSLIIFHHIFNRTSKEHDGLNFDDIFKLEYDQKDNEFTKNSDELFNNLNINTYNGNNLKNNYDEALTDEPTLRANKTKFPSTLSSSTSSASSIITSKLEKPFKLSDANKPSEENQYIDFVRSKSLVYHNSNEDTVVCNSKSPCRSLDIKLEVQKLPDYFDSPYLNSLCSNLNTKRLFKSKSRLGSSNNNINSNPNSKSSYRSIECLDDQAMGNENSDEDEIKQNLVAVPGEPNSPHLNNPKLALINPTWSGIAFYVDLHGHAAKRGCFIYGNAIDNELYQIENVLFAKLIAFNSQHFDFEGCNFSVKNMYMKDKREGLSKEGSGRVAMYKLLGLIHSYTLECCYASGRVMNSIAPATNTAIYARNASMNSGMISPPLHTDIPPKFLPEHYADVGKALAIAALDISELNPHTRIPNTSFGNLEAVRNWVKFFIRSKNGGGLNVNTLNETFSSTNNNNTSLINETISSKSNSIANGKKSNQRNLTNRNSISKNSFSNNSNNAVNNSSNSVNKTIKQSKIINTAKKSNTLVKNLINRESNNEKYENNFISSTNENNNKSNLRKVNSQTSTSNNFSNKNNNTSSTSSYQFKFTIKTTKENENNSIVVSQQTPLLTKPSTPLSTLTTTALTTNNSTINESDDQAKLAENSIKNKNSTKLNDRKLIPLSRTSITTNETAIPNISNTSTIFFKKPNSSQSNRNKQAEGIIVNSKSSNDVVTGEKNATQNKSNIINKKFMTTTSLILKNARETTNQLNKSEPIVYNKYSVLEDKTKNDQNKTADFKPEFTLYETKRQNTAKLSNKALIPKVQSLLVKQAPIKK